MHLYLFQLNRPDVAAVDRLQTDRRFLASPILYQRVFNVMPVDVVALAIQRVALRDFYIDTIECDLHRSLSFHPPGFSRPGSARSITARSR